MRFGYRPLLAAFAVLAGAMTVGASMVWAHPGHGETDPASPLHAAEPVHLLPVVVTVVLVAVVGMFVRKRLTSRAAARRR